MKVQWHLYYKSLKSFFEIRFPGDCESVWYEVVWINKEPVF